MCVEMIHLQSHSRGRRGCRVNIYSKYSLRCERTENIVLRTHMFLYNNLAVPLCVVIFFPPTAASLSCTASRIPPGHCPKKVALPTTGNPSPAVYGHTSLTHCLALVFQGRRGRVSRVPVPDRRCEEGVRGGLQGVQGGVAKVGTLHRRRPRAAAWIGKEGGISSSGVVRLVRDV